MKIDTLVLEGLDKRMKFLKMKIKQIIWRMRNMHNATKAAGDSFPLKRVTVGKGTYGDIRAISYGIPEEGLSIGSYCSIAKDVTFLLGGRHSLECISTYPFRVRMLDARAGQTDGPIVVEDDVWIGHGALIMSGVVIGQGSVVGARALVNKDVPPYTIVGGVPAKPIRRRFTDEVCECLSKLDISRINTRELQRHIELLETPVTLENVSEIINALGVSDA